MGGKKPLRRPLWPPTRATASNYYPLGLDGAGGAAKPLLRAPKKPAPLHGRLPAFSGAVDAFERARKCFLEWRYFFSIILSEFLKNRVALQWQIRDGDYLYPVFVATTENEEVLTAEQRNLEYWNDMALKGTIYHQPEYKPSTPSQNQTGGTNHGSNGLRDEYDNPEDLYEYIRTYEVKEEDVV